MESLKAKVLLWADVGYTDMEEIGNAMPTAELGRALCRVQGIHMTQSRIRVLMDLYFHTLLFCWQRGFNREQTSVLLSIVKAIHENNMETFLINIDDIFTYCNEVLLCHSARRPPFGVDLFSSEQVTQISQYFVKTYFRHYTLYKYVFTDQVRLELSLSYFGTPCDLHTEDCVSSGTE
ncbi:coiled-coil domain-containing protein 189 isoform X2 [Megalops cyprinoides]|uniref:coiled-coil domain-containing protein 189 isoform X2 n=1 Tax=Megalops cyprinoides TaxID=118141 RepID=UPI00186498E8|nr:coiled-coil domain-containing protein 189 isoform X2 [Megalops cyprinoides]